jgi:2,4-dienoyl-CoA reductase (NADPH2)
LLQRKPTKPGKDLGKTTGWIHRRTLNLRGVKMMAGVSYRRIDNFGLHITFEEQEMLLEVDHIVICAGQIPLRELHEPLREEGLTVHLVGGADKAVELDAKLAIKQASELAATI